jgi:hypothetical protein
MPQFFTCFAAAIFLGCTLSAVAQENNSSDTTLKAKELKEVTLTATKSAIETSPGKTILNVNALAGTGGKNALELLRRLPGITVDGMGNISVTGKQGILVLVNGRQTYLSGDDLRDYLQSMTSEEVAQIELMTQPSARYDAEGNSGIINIRTRKTRRRGLNGNANTVLTKSRYEGANSTVLVNYNHGKTNWLTSVNHINAMSGVDWRQDMHFTDNAGKTIARSVMTSAPVERFEKTNLRFGADRSYSENTSAGFTLTGAYYANEMNTPINTLTTLPGGDVLHSERHTNENSLRRNATANAYLKHTFSKTADLNINLDYLLYTKRLFQYVDTRADSNGIVLPAQLRLRGRVPTNIAVYSGKADYTKTFENGTKLECGGKHSYVSVDNAAYFMQHNAGQWADDATRTNRFLYKEHISALYGNVAGSLGEKLQLQAGLRAELALLNGTQQATGIAFSRTLPAIFPTVYLNYKADSSNTFEVNYGRRIQRPQYAMLNPFNYYTFYNTYQRGNPDLLPQYTHNVELRHSYAGRFTTELELSTAKNAISYISMPDTVAGTTFGLPVNFNSNRNASLGFTYNGNPAPWCQLMVNATGLYALYRGMVAKKAVENEGVGYRVTMYGSFVLGEWGADCYGGYNSPMAASAVSASISGIYMNFGVSHKFFHDTTTIRLNVDDPFYLNRTGNKDEQPGLSNYGLLRGNTRTCAMVVTYNFGRNDERRAARAEHAVEEAKRM